MTSEVFHDLSAKALVDGSGESRPRADAAKLLEAILACVVLFLSSGALFQLIRQPNGQSAATTANAGFEGTFLIALYGLGVVLLTRHIGDFRRAVTSRPFFWAIPALALASQFWSTDPAVTSHNAITLIAAMLYGAYFGLRFRIEEQVYVVATTLGVIVFLSLLLVFLVPTLGIDAGAHQGQWRGVFIHKNAFGRAAALAFSVFLLLGVTSGAGSIFGWIGAAVCITAIGFSASKTSAGVAGAMAVLIGLRPVLSRLRVHRWVVAAGLFTVVGILVALTVTAADGAARGAAGQETLTGRTVLWALVAAKIMTRPVLGFGYTAFWGGSTGAYVDLWRILGWEPPHSHNGFLDVALDLGLVGLTLFTIAFTGVLVDAFKVNYRSGSPLRFWPAVIGGFVLLSNLTESAFARNNLFWVLFTSAAVSLAHTLEQPKLTIAPASTDR